MAFTGNNPRFNSTILTDIGLASVSNPPSGAHKLINRGGTFQVKDSSGLETAIGAGGTVDRITQTAHGFSEGEVLYFDGTDYARALANAANTSEIVGMVSRVIDVDTFELTLEGKVTGLSGLTAGEVYFLSPITSGLITATEPTVLGHVSLPVGVAISATVFYVRSSRGAVVGSTNARTEIALANNAVSNVQSVAAYQAGELTGWVEIDGTTDSKFYVSAPFAKNGAGTDYNISPQYVGDTPPVGFSLSVTSGGLIQATLPSIAGYVSAKINFALNAPAVGVTLPLAIDSTLVQFSTLKAKDSGGFVFQENGGTQIGSWSDTGALTVGPNAATINHTLNGSLNIANAGSSFTQAATYPYIGSTQSNTLYSSSGVGDVYLSGGGYYDGSWRNAIVNRGGTYLGVISGSSESSAVFNFATQQNYASSAGTVIAHTVIGSATSAGAWMFGPGGTDANHNFNGILTVNGKANGDSLLQLNATSSGDESGIAFLVGGVNKWAIGRSPGEAPGNFNFYNYTTASIVAQINETTGSWTLGDTTNTTGHIVNGNGSSFRPGNDNNMNLGITGNRWAAVFAANGTIQTSDERLKKNIVDADPMLEKILKLKPRKFESKYDSYDVGNAGFIAQELEQVFPGLVQTQEDTIEGHEGIKTLCVSGSEMISYLVKAIQELSARLVALENKGV
jgi:hypothetical protein